MVNGPLNKYKLSQTSPTSNITAYINGTETSAIVNITDYCADTNKAMNITIIVSAINIHQGKELVAPPSDDINVKICYHKSTGEGGTLYFLWCY